MPTEAANIFPAIIEFGRSARMRLRMKNPNKSHVFLSKVISNQLQTDPTSLLAMG